MVCVVHLAGTGDHTFNRRVRCSGPLLKENIAIVVLEGPFDGSREGATANDPTTIPAGPDTVDEGERGRTEQPRRSAKPTMCTTEFVYF